MKLTTKRLILRDLTMKDAKDLVGAINNINISKWLGVVPYPYTIKDARWFINHCKKGARKKPRTSYNFGVELKAEHKIVGGLGLSEVNRYKGTADIGYWLGEDYWRKGYMREATTKLIDYAFSTLKLRRIRIPAFADNKASNGLAKVLGFTYEGRLRKAAKCKATGKIHDENVWGLLKEGWRN